MSGGVSIALCTARQVCGFQWFVDSLAPQLGDDDAELIVVDGLYSPERAHRFAGIVGNRMAFRHVAAKPTPFNGPYRVTPMDFFAAASARNTAVVFARKPYIVFVDDSAILAPGWWAAVREAANARIVVSGSYAKRWRMLVRNGILLSSHASPEGLDSRWNCGDDHGVVRIAGSHFFTATAGLPRELLLELNGFDELCDGCGGEDYQLGLRIQNAGIPLFYDRRIHTIESEELGWLGPTMRRYDPTIEEGTYLSKLRTFGVTSRVSDAEFKLSAMTVDIAIGSRMTRSLGNYYSLRDLGPDDLARLPARFPRRHWFNDCPLSEISPDKPLPIEIRPTAAFARFAGR